LGERSCIAQVGHERIRAFGHKALQSPRVASYDAHFLPFDSKKLAMIDPVFPLAPKITYVSSDTPAALSLEWFTFVSPFFQA
jgi:hypothetical protein